MTRWICLTVILYTGLGCSYEQPPTGGTFPLSVTLHEGYIWVAASRFDSEQEVGYAIDLFKVAPEPDKSPELVYSQNLPELTGEPIPVMAALLVTRETSRVPDLWFDADYFKATDYLTRHGSDGALEQWVTAQPKESRRVQLHAIWNARSPEFIWSGGFGYLAEGRYIELVDDVLWANCEELNCRTTAQVGQVFVVQDIDRDSKSPTPVTHYTSTENGPFLGHCFVDYAPLMVHTTGTFPVSSTTPSFRPFGERMPTELIDEWRRLDFFCGDDGNAMIVDIDRRVHFFDVRTSAIRTTDVILSRPSRQEFKGWPGRPVSAVFDGRRTWYVAASYVSASQSTDGILWPFARSVPSDINVYGMKLWAIDTTGAVLWQTKVR